MPGCSDCNPSPGPFVAKWVPLNTYPKNPPPRTRGDACTPMQNCFCPACTVSQIVPLSTYLRWFYIRARFFFRRWIPAAFAEVTMTSCVRHQNRYPDNYVIVTLGKFAGNRPRKKCPVFNVKPPLDWESLLPREHLRRSHSEFFLCAIHAFHTFQISGKLGFCIFGTGFTDNLTWVLPKLQKFDQNLLKKHSFLSDFELSFSLRTGFFEHLGNWVFQNSELGFPVLHKKKPD